jgi:hypothetical protein
MISISPALCTNEKARSKYPLINRPKAYSIKSPETALCTCSECLTHLLQLSGLLFDSLDLFSPETRRHSPLGNGIRDRQPRSNVLPISLFLHRPKEAIRQHLIPCQTPSRTHEVLFCTSVAELHIPDWRHSSLWSLPGGRLLRQPLPCVHHSSRQE